MSLKGQCHEIVNPFSLVKKLAGLVAQSVMSATDTLGNRDIHGLSAIDPRPRQWIFASALCPRMLACRYNWCW